VGTGEEDDGFSGGSRRSGIEHEHKLGTASCIRNVLATYYVIYQSSSWPFRQARRLDVGGHNPGLVILGRSNTVHISHLT
jgi:hypothetical protein